MPHAGPPRTSSIFLQDRQTAHFGNRTDTGRAFEDRDSITHRIVSGAEDDNQRHYGVFDGLNLVGYLALSRSSDQEHDCPTPYWSIGMIEIDHRYQGRRIGPGLMDGVWDLLGESLASDLDQDGGGADLWKRWIKMHPGEVELHGPNAALLGVVTQEDGAYTPNPWSERCTRLVRTYRDKSDSDETNQALPRRP